MSAAATTGLTLDTGALLALDHPAKAVAMQARLEAARQRGGTICIPAEAVAQASASPGPPRPAAQVSDIDIAVMTLSAACSIGLLCADTDRDDVVDVHVVLCARQRHHAIVTSDPRDIARIDPTVPRILV